MSFNLFNVQSRILAKTNSYTYVYIITERSFKFAHKKLDLNVIVTNDLKHCKAACLKANTMLRLVARKFECNMSGLIISWSISLVRPHYKCSMQVIYKKGTDLRGSRAPRLNTATVAEGSAVKQLKLLNFLTRKNELLRGDMIQLVQYLNKLNDTN